MTDDRPRQLPLTLPHRPALGRADFLEGHANRDALALIERWPDWSAPVVLLSGPAGSGKTHLVEIWRALSGSDVVAAADLGRADPQVLLAGNALAVEAIDQAPDREAELFHLLNLVREKGATALLTSRLPAAALPVRLPDLASRLRAAQPVLLSAPDDALLRRVLVKLFADRQLSVDAALVDFMLRRMERSLGAAERVVAAVDRAALAEGRRVGRLLVGRVLEELFPDEEA